MSSIKKNLNKKHIDNDIIGFESGEKMMEMGIKVLDFDVFFLDA